MSDGVGGPVYALAGVRYDACIYVAGAFDRVCNDGGGVKAVSCALESDPLNFRSVHLSVPFAFSASLSASLSGSLALSLWQSPTLLPSLSDVP